MSIAKIAYDNLSEKAKVKVNYLYDSLSKQAVPTDFIRSSTWADDIRYQNIKKYNQWHYIHLPINNLYSSVNSIVPEPNIKTATIQQISILQNTQSSILEQAWSLRMLIHLIGDLHQPLHVATLYNAKFKYGDLNGLKFKIKSRYKNLHRFWDVGGGLLAYKKRKSTRLLKLTNHLQKKYKLTSKLNKPCLDKLINIWLQASYNTAKQYVYKQKYNKKITVQYRQKVKQISEQQLFKAGHNLAIILNSIYV